MATDKTTQIDLSEVFKVTGTVLSSDRHEGTTKKGKPFVAVKSIVLCGGTVVAVNEFKMKDEGEPVVPARGQVASFELTPSMGDDIISLDGKYSSN